MTEQPLNTEVRVWITAETAGRLAVYAKQERTSESDIVELALNSYLDWIAAISPIHESEGETKGPSLAFS